LIAEGDQAKEQGEHRHPESERCEGQGESPSRIEECKTRTLDDPARERMQVVDQLNEHYLPVERDGGEQD
jgi:hypothetical protein